MNCYTVQRLKCAAFIVWVACVVPAFSQTRQIVLLYDERTDLPGLAMLDAGFVRALTSGSPDHVEVYREAMDLSRFDSNAYRNLLRDHLRAKYAGKKIDVAVAVMEPALDFLLSRRDEVFPGTPIVFYGIDKGRIDSRRLPSDVTGVLLKREFSPTLELVLSLHPETDRIAVVAGASEFDARVLEQAREEFRPFEDRLAFVYLTALPMPELLSQLSRLPPKTIVLYSTVFQDGARTPFVPHEVAERVSAAANVPVYGFVDQYLGRGIVGGRLYGLSAHSEAAARLVLKILKGTKLSELPLVEPVSSLTAFDWQQLQRWGIDESRLPSGANILFRPTSLWSEYKYYIIGGLVIIMAQTVTIAALVGHRARRRRAEWSLEESENRFRIAADTAPLMIWVTGTDKRCTFLNKRWLEFTGRTLAQELGEGWAESVHPDDRQKCLKTYHEAFDARQPFVMEYRLRRRDGEYRWISDAGAMRQDVQGNFAGYVGSCLDISESRRKAEALAESEGRLRAILDTAVEGIITINDHGVIESVNVATEKIFGYTAEEMIGQNVRMLMPAPYREEHDQYLVNHQGGHLPKIIGVGREIRGQRKDGSLFPIDLAVSEIVLADRRVFTGFVRDITERRQTEQTARELSGRLIAAQEAERARLARELHDDITQRLACLAIDAGRIESGMNGAERNETMRDVRDRLVRLSEDVHSLSYKLHPALLEDLGLPDALKAECERFSRHESLPVDVKLEQIPAKLPPDAGLCLFRVTQEALRNVARHAHAKAAAVSLRPLDGGLQLAVTDSGVGFDPGQHRHRPSLGLASMRERVRLVGGDLDIESAPGHGTSVVAWVPVNGKEP
jgi:PAS domain S-box-containing protein